MKQLLRKGTIIISLLLLLGTTLLWIRSFWCDDYASVPMSLRGDTVQVTAESVRGTLEFRITRMPGMLLAGTASLVTDVPGGNPAYPAALWSFSAERAGDGLAGPGTGRIGIYFPLWMVMIVSCAVPVLMLLRRPKRPPNTCAHCGYDLRATPDRCPECGTVVAPRGI
jgi:hypothetical protein